MTRAGAWRGGKPGGGPRAAAPGDICAAGSAGEMQLGRGDAASDDDGAAMTTVPRVARGRMVPGPRMARGKPARAVLVGRTVRALAQGAAPQGPRAQVWRRLWCLSTIRSRLEEFLLAKACAVVQ
jgi:hypothetical protein